MTHNEQLSTFTGSASVLIY